MRVACIQLTTTDNYEKNFKKTIILVNQAIKKNSDLILTPEATSIISSIKNRINENIYSMRSDPLIKEIKKIAKKNKKWILIGSIFVRENHKLRNRSIMIGPNGFIKAYYDKINMFDVKLNKREKHKESDVFVSGNKLRTVNLPWGKLGLTICFDLRFPEIFRKLSQKNLRFIAVPSAFTKITGKKHWLPLLRARAIENFCYIFAPAQVGKNTKTRETFGHTAIISPDGKVLKIKKNKTGVIYKDIDIYLPLKLRKIIPSIKIKKI